MLTAYVRIGMTAIIQYHVKARIAVDRYGKSFPPGRRVVHQHRLAIICRIKAISEWRNNKHKINDISCL